jgi:hypothetical protein
MAGWKQENSYEGGTCCTRWVPPPADRVVTPGIPGIYDKKQMDKDSRSMKDDNYEEVLLLDEKQACRFFYTDMSLCNDSSRGTVRSTTHWGAMLGTYIMEDEVVVCDWTEHMKCSSIYDKDGESIEKDWEAMAPVASTKWRRLTLSSFHKRTKPEEEAALMKANTDVSLGLFSEHDSTLQGLLKLEDAKEDAKEPSCKARKIE